MSCHVRIDIVVHRGDEPNSTKSERLRRVVQEVLAQHEGPIRASDLRNEVAQQAPQLLQGMSYENFVNYLSRMKGVTKVGRGLWMKEAAR